MSMMGQFEFKHITNLWKRFKRKASLLRLVRYEIQLEFISGKDNAAADALSGVDPLSLRPMHAKQMDLIPVYQITYALPATDNRLDRTRTVTTADPALCQLRHYHGWLLQKSQHPEQVQHYWNYREELAIEDGLVFKAHRLAIPNSQSRISEGSPCRSPGRGENSFKYTWDSFLAWNLR